MKIGIVGWGLEAQSAYRFFGPDHEYLIVNESNQEDLPTETEKVKVQFISNPAPVGIGGQVQDLSYLEGIENCDKIVYQPTSIFNLQKIFKDDNDFWSKATTVYDIFFENSPTKNIIGVTGTKGKGTTSTLIAKMIEAQGKPVHLGGNIGTPILDLLPKIKEGDWLVWELANFQLKPAHYSPHVGVCLMIVRDHMDWHPDMEDYVEAKANIFRFQNPDDVAIYFPDNEYSTKIARYSPGKKVPYFSAPGARVREDGMIIIGDDERELIHKSEVKLLGEHNLQNVCAASTTVFEALGSLDNANQVLSSFSGLEHRLELVREFEGVKYYDDSFATTPETTIVAIKAIKEPKTVILGGHDKDADFSQLADEIVKSDVIHVITIGTVGPKIAELLRGRSFESVTEGLKDMESIVADARNHAKNGGAVLLSCATSSFGLFKDYKERGNQFKQAVQALS
jgi:UDP-N-acetylmuramoylalanine--D-glutamate ligase